MRKIALLAVATIGMAMPAYAQYSQYSPYNGTTLNRQYNGIWNNPNDRYQQRHSALVRKLERKISQLETRLRLRSVSFRERMRLNREIRELRWQLSHILQNTRRY